MCGIVGYYSFSASSEDFRARLDHGVLSLAHRGPDNNGTFAEHPVYLGQTRLSIVDVSDRGNQPMFDVSGNFVIVYNGECYNHLQLRKKLEDRGIKFTSDSDTETVLYWLINHGADGLKDINGFFSLALYDKRNKKLLLARDRFGIKPLYYSADPSGFSFGSELNATKVFIGKCSINQMALSAYLHLNYIPSPYTIFNEVSKLLPGTYVTINRHHKVEMHRYYNLEYEFDAKVPNAEKSIAAKLESSVKKRMMADVPLGCFLSGGLDSSIITGLASRHTDKLNTYTLIFKDQKQYDESKDARLVSKHFGSQHHELEISKGELLENAINLLQHMDEPFADSSALAMYNLSKKVSTHVKVALSGDGGDELFAGYYKHLALYYSFEFPELSKKASSLNPLFSKMPRSRESGIFNAVRKWEKYSASAVLPPSLRYWNWAGYGNPMPELLKNNAFSPVGFMSAIKGGAIKSFEDCLNMDLSMVLEGDMLVKTDRMSMMHGLEVRVPFLDHELVELVNRIPAKQKIGLNKKKKLLKESFSHMLPKQILNKKKHGFEVPLKQWLANELKNEVETSLKSSIINEQGIFDASEVEKLIRLSRSNHSANSEYTVWNLMVFSNWLKNNSEIVS